MYLPPILMYPTLLREHLSPLKNSLTKSLSTLLFLLILKWQLNTLPTNWNPGKLFLIPGHYRKQKPPRTYRK